MIILTHPRETITQYGFHALLCYIGRYMRFCFTALVVIYHYIVYFYTSELRTRQYGVYEFSNRIRVVKLYDKLPISLRVYFPCYFYIKHIY